MSVLTRIVKRAKQMKKARPNKHKKWTGYVKDASKEYQKSGFKKPRAKTKKRKKSVSSVGKVRKVRARKRRVTVKKVVVRRRRATRKKSVTVRRRRVGASGGSMKSLMPVLVLGGLGLAAFLLLRKNNSTTPPAGGYPPLIASGNTARDQTSQNILNYAMAAGLATDAIIKLIQALNTKSDADVQKVAQTIDSGGGIPDWIMYG